MQRIYFDHSATTPVDERVVVTMTEYMLEKFGNPSSAHSFGREAKAAMDKARESVASMLNCDPAEVFFTSGGTEADNLALIGYALANRQRGNEIVISNIEHPAVKAAAIELESLGFNIKTAPADRYGEVTLEALKSLLSGQTLLVSIMHINNEIGTINDIERIGEHLCERNITFHSDAVQSFGKVPIDVRKMHIDMLSLSGHKIYGPKGIGALYVRDGLKLHPRQFGGKHEAGLRSGTENLPGIVGLGVATDICRQIIDDEASRLTELRDELFARLDEKLDAITLNGHPSQRLPGNLNITFQGVEGEALLVALDLEGIAVSSGSACSSGSTKPSAVLLALGMSEIEAQSSIRITLGRDNTPQDIDYASRIIVDSVERLRRMSGN
ncbi:MAG: cysteine desulfurase [Calditrichaeota bacterium]|nr:cysteine desulfurase [Calditrichota bacterium]